jgi:adenosine deaminase
MSILPTTATPPGQLPLREFIQLLPKAENHLHLEGSVPWELLKKYAPTRFASPPPFWEPDFRWRHFDDFMNVFVMDLAPFFSTPEAYHESAKIILRRCAEQNVKYVEISMHFAALLAMPGRERECLAGIREAAPEGLTVRVLGGFLHDDRRPHLEGLMDAALEWPELDGIDLHGPEYPPLEAWSGEYWARARAAGKFTRAHAGEFMGPDFVKQVVEELGVTRIMHGIRSYEDPALLPWLVERNVTFDICPLSNLKLVAGGLKSLKEHPLRTFLEAGITCSISTDDTYLFGNNLTDDYEAVHNEMGFSRAELVQLAINGFLIAQWPYEEKLPYIRELEAIKAAL